MRATHPWTSGRRDRVLAPAAAGVPDRPLSRRSRPRVAGYPVGPDRARSRVGCVGSQRLALPLTIVRAEADDPRPGTPERLVVRAADHQCGEDDAVVLDAGFGVALLHEEGAARYVVRCAKNSVFRRAAPPPYGGRGRPATRGEIVRPLSRAYKGRLIPATPPDRTETWEEDGVTPRARSSTRPKPASDSPHSPSSPGPSCRTSRPPPRPSRPASGTAAPNPRPAASGAPAGPARGASRCDSLPPSTPIVYT